MVNGVIIEWTEENIDHIKKHNIEPAEVESIFESRLFYRRRKGFFDFLGKTGGGTKLLQITWCNLTYLIIMFVQGLGKESLFQR